MGFENASGRFRRCLRKIDSRSPIAVRYCRVDLRSSSAILANGGMPFPFLVRGNGVSRLQIRGVFLGLIEDIGYDELEFKLEPGGTLSLSSDGTTDALNREGEFYDAERFTDSMRRHCAGEISLPLDGLHSDFTGDAE